MTRAASGSVIRQIELLFEGSSVTGLTDRQLLEWFNAWRDLARETAFAALVTRHGLMVLDICRQFLGDLHHAEEVLRSMLLNKLRLTVLTLLFLGAGATGAGYLSRSLAMKDDPRKPPAGQQPRLAVKPEDARQATAPGRMIVAGHVLDPSDKPVVGVPVDVIGRARKPWVAGDDRADRHVVLGQGMTNADGRFCLDALRSSWVGFFEVYTLAAAPGFGLGWIQLNTDAKQPAADIRLRTEQIIRGKLVDVNGQPVAGVKIGVWSVGRPSNIGTFDGVNLGDASPPEGRCIWPRPASTDANGRFTLAGIGCDLTVTFSVRDPRFAHHGFRVQTDDQGGPNEITLALQLAKTVEGRALAADTGQPIPHAIVGGFRADGQGRFAANVVPRSRSYRVQAVPPEG